MGIYPLFYQKYIFLNGKKGREDEDLIAKLRREEHLRLKIWAGGREYVIAHGKKRSSEKEDHDKQRRPHSKD